MRKVVLSFVSLMMLMSSAAKASPEYSGHCAQVAGSAIDAYLFIAFQELISSKETSDPAVYRVVASVAVEGEGVVERTYEVDFDDVRVCNISGYHLVSR